jgi:hypothetical protein
MIIKSCGESVNFKEVFQIISNDYKILNLLPFGIVGLQKFSLDFDLALMTKNKTKYSDSFKIEPIVLSAFRPQILNVKKISRKPASGLFFYILFISG